MGRRVRGFSRLAVEAAQLRTCMNDDGSIDSVNRDLAPLCGDRVDDGSIRGLSLP
jgi:hypothetical protein